MDLAYLLNSSGEWPLAINYTKNSMFLKNLPGADFTKGLSLRRLVFTLPVRDLGDNIFKHF